MSPTSTTSNTSSRIGRVQHALMALAGLQSSMLPIGCSAFRPIISASMTRPQTFSTRRGTTTCISCANRSIPGTDARDENIVQEFQCEDASAGGLELWLDLRGTSLTPKASLELWDLEESQSGPGMQFDGDETMEPSRKAPFVKCLVSSSDGEHDVHAPQNERHGDIGVLLVAESDDGSNGMMPIFHRTNPEMAIGRILPLQSSSSMPILPDPLPAMDAVSRGQWIILDTYGWRKVDEEDRLSMALPLLELVATGASGGGGIGLTCNTNNEVAKAAMFIETLSNASGGLGGTTKTKTLDSGIVVPDDSESSSSLLIGSPPQFAIVVPFDMGLLRTAKLLFADK